METPKAIVYESQTGFTKKYAELLSEELGIPAYERKLADSFLRDGEDILYLGWLMASSIKGYDKAAKKYTVKVACGVGMAAQTDNMQAQLEKRYNKPEVNFFYLQGGFNVEKLKGFNKFIMKIMSKFVSKALAKKENKTEEETMMMNLMKDGGNFVKVENLQPIISQYK